MTDRTVRESCAKVFERLANEGHMGHRMHMLDRADKIRRGQCDNDTWVMCAAQAVQDLLNAPDEIARLRKEIDND